MDNKVLKEINITDLEERIEFGFCSTFSAEADGESTAVADPHYCLQGPDFCVEV